MRIPTRSILSRTSPGRQKKLRTGRGKRFGQTREKLATRWPHVRPKVLFESAQPSAPSLGAKTWFREVSGTSPRARDPESRSSSLDSETRPQLDGRGFVSVFDPESPQDFILYIRITQRKLKWR